MSSAQTEPRQMRQTLAHMLTAEIGGCTGCGVCVSECGFLKLYGSPRQIIRSYDPDDPKKNVVCFECSLCGLCTAVCPEKLDPQALFLEMRREAVERGFGSFPEHKGLLGYERTGTSRRFSWYGLPDGCTTVFFPGCALPGTRPAATTSVYEQLQQKIPALGLVMDCCTKPSHDLGRQEYFRQMFNEMANWLEGYGVQRVLVACPNCYKVFSEYGKQFVTETIYEELAEIWTDAGIQPDSAVVTIHDPCVVRNAGAPQEAVRRLLTAAGSRIEEMPHSRATALCCGKGGTVGALAPDLADAWGKRRTKEAAGRQVITYCAGCANHLGKHLNVSHVLDVVCKTPKPSSGPITYLNRLRLKSRFKKLVPATVTRERIAPKAGTAGVLKPVATWSLNKSLRLKGIVVGIFAAFSTGVYLLIQKFFWALDAYLYTIEFNLLFIMSRFRDADLAAFVEYLRPMSPLRASGIALVSRTMQNYAFILSPLKLEQAFLTAYGPLNGVLLATASGVAICALMTLCGRLLFGDLLPLLNQRRKKEPLAPAATWSWWSALALLSVPFAPLLVGGLWAGALRIPWGRLLALITTGMVVRILISLATR